MNEPKTPIWRPPDFITSRSSKIWFHPEWVIHFSDFVNNETLKVVQQQDKTYVLCIDRGDANALLVSPIQVAFKSWLEQRIAECVILDENIESILPIVVRETKSERRVKVKDE